MKDDTTQHWSKTIAEEAINRMGERQRICGGWSPSGIFHVGNAREMITCNAFNRMLKMRSADSEFIFVIDDTDPLDKIPKIFKKYTNVLKPYLGHPINRVPDPTGEYESYAEYFASGIIKSANDWGIAVRFIRASELYKAGKYDKYLKLYLEKEDTIQEIMEEISGSPLKGFFNVICEGCGNLKTTQITDSSDINSIKYICKTDRMYKGCDFEGTTSIEDRQWKLKWRLDWPARQSFLGVTIEPAGKDHAADGGSIDTTIAIHERVFGKPGPLMPGYGFIVMKGKKMSGSKDGIPAANLINFMDPYSFLFMVYRNNQRRDIEFKLETGEYGDLSDEFVAIRRAMNGKEFYGTDKEFEKLKVAAQLALPEDLYSVIPANIKFSELALLYQTNFKDKSKLINKLRALGKLTDEDDPEELNQRIDRIGYWLENLAPDSMKFEILTSAPENISDFWNEKICAIWKKVLTTTPDNIDNKEFLNHLREITKEQNAEIKPVFKAFYQLLLGKNVGPNAAGLVDSLGRAELLKKIEAIC